MAFFFILRYLFCSREFSYCANLVTADVIGCASTVVRHKIKNTSANNVAMILKLGRDVAPYVYKIYQMVPILMLLWQQARYRSPASSTITMNDHHE